MIKYIETIIRDIEKFDMVLLLGDSENKKLLKTYGEAVLRESPKHILILSSEDLSDFSCGRHEYRRILKEEEMLLKRLYSLYDFSNRFQLISDNTQCGSLMNYVKTGIMTMEEVFRVLLI